MFERFSAHARHSIVLAQEEARGLDQSYIGTEHLLLGLLAESEGIAARALSNVGVTSDATRLLIVKDVGRGKKRPEGHIPFTPRAKKTLELALREALALQHNYVGTEHLLLGQLRLDDGLGAKLLYQQGVDSETLRQATLHLLVTAQADQGPRWRRLPGSRPETAIDDIRATRAADESLEKAHRLAGAEAVGSQHLLLAALSDPTSAAAKALSGLGIDLDKARLALSKVDVTGTSDDSRE
jgi:ATP-dependent Clp protease ATP-binding subunit ClpA